MVAETFWSLLHDPAHWEFEIFLMVIFDGLIGAIAWPLVKTIIRRHDENNHEHVCCKDPIAEQRIAALERKIQSLEWAESLRMDDGQ